MVLLLCVSFATVVYSQNPVESDDVIRTDSDLTNLLLTATDKQRRFITSRAR